MKFNEWAKHQADAGLAEVHTLHELQHAETGAGPWKLYVYDKNGYHRGGKWFRKGSMQYPDEEITFKDAEEQCHAAIQQCREVRICDGGDNLVFHAKAGAIIYGENFWTEAS